MKNTPISKLITFTAITILTFSACGQTSTPATPSTSETPSKSQESQPPVPATTEEVVSSTKSVDYSKWAIKPSEYTGGRLDFSFNYEKDGTVSKDCVGIFNGYTGGGDLLSSLIVDDANRELANLNVYTKDYVKSLESKSAKHTQEKYKSDFYAFYICHLADGLDVAAGYIYPQGQPTIYTKDAVNDAGPKELAGDVVKDFQKTSALLIIDGQNVSSIKVENNLESKPEDLRLMNNTATGAEVPPCDAVSEGKNIRWSCFLGLRPNEDGTATIGSINRYWLLDRTGKILETKEYQHIPTPIN